MSGPDTRPRTNARDDGVLDDELRELVDREEDDEDEQLEGVNHCAFDDDAHDGQQIERGLGDDAGVHRTAVLAPDFEGNHTCCYNVLCKGEGVDCPHPVRYSCR